MTRPILGLLALTLGLTAATPSTRAQSAGPNRVLQTVKAGGEGGFDYFYADVAGRRLYIPRSGPGGRIMVFDLDGLKLVGEIAGVLNGHGATVDPRSGHGFASSKPIAMWDAKSLALIKTIDVQGSPDGILDDPAGQRVYVLSHSAPNITVINAVDGSVTGTIDLGGLPEQTVADGAGRLYSDLVNKDQVAVIDAKSMTKTGAYGLNGKCGHPAGLALDAANHVLFVACHDPQTMAMLNAQTGDILAVLPIGADIDAAVFNPATREAFTAGRDGTLTVIKELSPTSFVLEPTVKIPLNAKAMTVDAKTSRVLLMGAEFEPVAAASTPRTVRGAATRPARGAMAPGSFSIIVVGR